MAKQGNGANIRLNFVKSTPGTYVFGNEDVGNYYFRKEWFHENVSKQKPDAIIMTIAVASKE